jgi:hypothetical protein
VISSGNLELACLPCPGGQRRVVGPGDFGRVSISG